MYTYLPDSGLVWISKFGQGKHEAIPCISRPEWLSRRADVKRRRIIGKLLEREKERESEREAAHYGDWLHEERGTVSNNPIRNYRRLGVGRRRKDCETTVNQLLVFVGKCCWYYSLD